MTEVILPGLAGRLKPLRNSLSVSIRLPIWPTFSASPPIICWAGIDGWTGIV